MITRVRARERLCLPVFVHTFVPVFVCLIYQEVCLCKQLKLRMSLETRNVDNIFMLHNATIGMTDSCL